MYRWKIENTGVRESWWGSQPSTQTRSIRVAHGLEDGQSEYMQVQKSETSAPAAVLREAKRLKLIFLRPRY